MGIAVPPELIERDPAVIAPAAGLRYLPDSEPGLTRRRCGQGFTYVDADGATVRGESRDRAEALAIPPAWDRVWICADPDGYLQATGVDDADRKQYRYHERFREFCDERKFERLRYFPRALTEIRKRQQQLLDGAPGGRDYAVAAAVRLIDECLLRVGNDRSAADGHYGATTLTVEHVVDDGFVALEYDAKGGKTRTVIVEDDELGDILVDLATDADDELFWFVDAGGERRRATASDINVFIAETVGPAFSAKDFRTWGGSCVALAARRDGASALEAVDHAAEELGNTRAVARSAYVHPLVLDAPIDQVDALWTKSRSSRWMSRDERLLAKLLDS